MPAEPIASAEPGNVPKASLWQRLQTWQLLGLGPAMWLFIASCVGLPFVMYRALEEHTGQEALRQARAVSLVASAVRSYYTSNVVGPALRNQGQVTLSENYHQLAGGIPIPATFAIELGDAIRERAGVRDFEFRFMSDLPFRNRSRSALDEFQLAALRAFRGEQREGDANAAGVTKLGTGNLMAEAFWRVDRRDDAPAMLRLAVPVRMEANCVACHNGHPDSPVRNWKVSDVRGIQEVAVEFDTEGQLRDSMGAVAYLGWFSALGLLALREHRSRVRALNRLNAELDGSRRALQDNTRQLQASIRDLRTKTTVLDMAPFGILVMEPVESGMRIQYANRAFSDSMGYEHDEVVGRYPRFLFGPQTDAQALDDFDAALRERRRAEVEMLSYTRAGEPRVLRWLVFPSYGNDGTLLNFVACLNDVTEMRQGELERQQLASELQESTKLEFLGLAIAGIAHDLNTPIGVAVTASTVVQQSSGELVKAAAQEPAPLDQVRRLSERIGKSAELVSRNLARAAQLVQSFKQTSADASRDEWRRVRLGSLLESLSVTMSSVMRRAQCEVVLRCPPQVELYTEPGALSQAVTNLMVNATLHAFEGVEHRVVTIEVTEQADTVSVSVADNGRGMSEEAAMRAFTPFFTTRRAQGGSGLGLFSSRRVVEQVLGGRIGFETGAGRGTRFLITLPRRRPAEAIQASSGA